MSDNGINLPYPRNTVEMLFDWKICLVSNISVTIQNELKFNILARVFIYTCMAIVPFKILAEAINNIRELISQAKIGGFRQ